MGHKTNEKKVVNQDIQEALQKREFQNEQRRLTRLYGESRLVIQNMEKARNMQEILDDYETGIKVYVVGNLTIDMYEAMRRPTYQGGAAYCGKRTRSLSKRVNTVGYGCQTKHARRGVRGHPRCKSVGKKQFLKTCGVDRDEAFKCCQDKKPNLEQR